MLKSQLCREADFRSVWFAPASAKLKEPFRYHRKLWEWCYIYEALRERGMLRPDARGLGFGVGREPLAAAFAAHGCEIVATDLDAERAKAQGWADSNQHAIGMDDLNERGICEAEPFRNRVKYEMADMNAIPAHFAGQFDFTWSSCSFEHLGSIEAGIAFIVEQMNCLRPGGVAVHTTEFNLSSDVDTLESDVLVLFRRRDVEDMAARLRARGYRVEIDYTAGTGDLESYVDMPPFRFDPHLRLLLDRFVSTSIGIIAHR